MVVVGTGLDGPDENVAAPSAVQDWANELLEHVALLPLDLVGGHSNIIDEVHAVLYIRGHLNAIILVQITNAIETSMSLLVH